MEETVIMRTSLIARLAPIARALGYVLAFLIPPLVFAGVMAARTWPKLGYNQPQPYTERPALPAHDPGKHIAVIIMSNIATELTDFLGPYEVLMISGALNVYGVAPEAKLVNLGQGLDVMPHFSFEEYNRVVGANPDLIVTPFMSNINTPENGPTTQWIRDHFGPTTTLLSICGGALNLAETGLLDGRPVTTYWDLYPNYTNKYPNVKWMLGQRFVDSGNVVTSAGITNGISATLYVLRIPVCAVPGQPNLPVGA
jgi:AraC family transcriptional regulator, transcriptional activator FtrA